MRGVIFPVLLGIGLAAIPVQDGIAQAQSLNGQGPGTAKVLIGIEGPVRPNDIKVVEALGGEVTQAFHLVNVIAAKIADTSKARELLLEDERITYVEPDLEVHAIGQQTPTGVDRIQVDGNTTASIGDGTPVDVDIAVIDTGVDLDHPDLNVERAVDATKGPNAEKGGDGDDGNGHGTHVAGIAGAKDNSQGVVGVAPGARIWGVKVLKDDGSGRLSDIIEGMQYVTDHAGQIEVANMSIGTTGESESQSWHDALINSVQAGVVYTIAAGNSEADVFAGNGPDSDNDGVIDGYLPAAYREGAAISALADSDGAPGGEGDPTSYGDDDTFATFSNYSVEDFPNDSNPVNSPGAAIDLLLPGVDIKSTWIGGGYNTISGTSMAAPHGAGLAALEIVANGRDRNGDTNHDDKDVYAVRQALIDAGVTQSSDEGLVNDGASDPDANHEKLGWAGEGAPSVSITNPSDGGTVEGTVTVTADASDSDGSVTQVEFFVDGNSIGTDSDGSDGWDTSWDTTNYGEGDHTVSATATDDDNKTSTDTITVTVDNNTPPTVTVTNPSDGDTVSGSVSVTADASDSDGSVTQVEFFVDSSSIGTDSDGADGWSTSWDTTAYSDGSHTVTAEATDDDSESASDSISVTVDNNDGSSSDMYVGDISFSQKDYGPGGSYHDLTTIVTIRRDSDANGDAESSDDPVSDASVAMTLTYDSDGDGVFDDGSWNFSGSTDSNGEVEFTLKRASTGDYQAEVTDVNHSSYTYNSSLDEDNPDTYTLTD